MPTDDAWRPAQYDRFGDERRAPFFDLLDLVEPAPGGRVLDLGCGTGALTRLVHERLGAAETLGVDRSAAMLGDAGTAPPPGVRFVRADLADFAPDGPVDVVFSNAALHWLPAHDGLFARLAAMLSPGGQLAVQVPANHDRPPHLVADRVAAEEPFRSALGSWRRTRSVLAPEAYALLLDRLGLERIHVRLQVYLHHLAGPEEVVEWVKGSLLTAYEQRLPADLFAGFLARYRELLLPELDDVRPFPFPFKRILLRARRPPAR